MVTTIPRDTNDAVLALEGRTVHLTNLRKPFWPRITKGDLLRYYASVAPVLLPHLRDRAMVMKRYPNGSRGEFFFMKHAPSSRPEWIETCSITHAGGNVVDFPMVQDLASLLWVVNLGCIDLNPWYSRCDEPDHPDVLVIDLDPVRGASFERVREAALVVREGLETLAMDPLVKTSGSRGIHVFVPIRRGPGQKQVWHFAKAFALALVADHPELLTAEFSIARRPRGHVFVDFNQNAWGRTLASVYSPRPRPRAPVSTPVTWAEVARGFAVADFRIDNMLARVAKLGDLWRPLLDPRARFDLASIL